MFGLSLVELIVVFFIGIICVKPSQWPELFQSIGRLYGQLSRFTHNVQYELAQLDPIQHTTPYQPKRRD